jgi:hypothetical protein
VRQIAPFIPSPKPLPQFLRCRSIMPRAPSPDELLHARVERRSPEGACGIWSCLARVPQ